MVLSIDSTTQRLIQRRIRSGRYASADDVVRAGLAALSQQEITGDFEAGELDALLAEGEKSMQQGRGISADEVFKDLRRRSQQRRATRRRKSA